MRCGRVSGGCAADAARFFFNTFVEGFVGALWCVESAAGKRVYSLLVGILGGVLLCRKD